MAAIPKDPNTNRPNWAGPPPGEPVPALRTPSLMGNAERPSGFPFADARESNPNLFPPICLRSHWDPEQIIRRTLPNAPLAVPLEPRPWTKVCLNYVTSQDFEDAPRPSDDLVMPAGGVNYPPSRFREAIDQESQLRRLDRPLGTCERDQYIPPRTGDMYRPNATVPDRGPISDRFIQELAFPMAAMRAGPYDCREQAEKQAWSYSTKLFNNTTKQDRYTEMRPDLTQRKRPQPMPTSLVNLS
jgi:hypothetical protein